MSSHPDPSPDPSTAAGPGAVRRLSGRMSGRVRSLFETGGPGFRDLALTQVASTAADTLVAVGLAGTLFFGVPSTEARANVALYLLLTVAPFAVIGPLLGRVLDRAPAATRASLVIAAVGRAVLAVLLLGRLDSLWLFPAAFGLLVLSRVHGITRNALLPLALDRPTDLVAANARLAGIGVAAGAIAAPLGILATVVAGPGGALALSAFTALAAATIGRRLPEPDAPSRRSAPGSVVSRPERIRLHLPRRVRTAQIATAVVRLLNGFLLLLLAFAFREAGAGAFDFGAVLAAAGGGFAVAAMTTPRLERRLREEPMVVAALAVEAAAAFSAGQWFGLPAAAGLAFAAGFAWGTAKLSFDGLLQSAVPAARRGAAFTRSETVFSLAWVLGAIVPTALPLPVGLGLPLAGFAALAAQIVYVSVLLAPDDTDRRASGR
ncbi:MFS transporter [Nitriliruptor alkaliphilus]|uniref:MFS transporter n=1 Tax=Nitriliruptor alkaliphilus TaxID=427918 RepID=UPI000698E9EB|nr:MFS transporter [Nitriliruptor alkaliphilus]